MSDTKTLKSLGSGKTVSYNKPSLSILETFKNLHPEANYLVPFVQGRDEFRSVCPRTKQPDVGKVEIIYVPNKLMVESKSLKLYLNSFANHGEFHEDCTNRIAKDLICILSPKYIRVFIDFASRGSLAIKPLVERIMLDITDKEKEKIFRLVDTWDIKSK
jgi:7-cyano-7-deazaguanine reductase